MKPEWIDSLTHQLPEWMRISKTPGAAVSVLQSGVPPEHFCFGVTSQEGGQPVSSQTVFQAASLSKPVFAYMALKLCESGLLDLDRPPDVFPARVGGPISAKRALFPLHCSGRINFIYGR